MDLEFPQARRLYLAGSVAFPTPFPTVGTITTKLGDLSVSPAGKGEDALLVIVDDEPGLGDATTRVMLAAHVSAIFIYKGEGNRVDDFENGEWILGSLIKADRKSEKPRTDAARAHPRRRGIVFLPEHRPVLTITECAQTAGATGAALFAKGGCECW
jgi:hypothetical protein